MTPEERAEKIVPIARAYARQDLLAHELVAAIAAQIREAVQEAEEQLLTNGTFANRVYKEGEQAGHERGIKELAKTAAEKHAEARSLLWNSYREGFLAAREMAAKTSKERAEIDRGFGGGCDCEKHILGLRPEKEK